jgi:hypothetical protein
MTKNTKTPNQHTNNPRSFDDVRAENEHDFEAWDLGSDLLAYQRHCEASLNAHIVGREPPPTPVPASRFLRGFQHLLQTKAHAVFDLLSTDERARLTKILPEVTRAAQANDPAIVAAFTTLIPIEPMFIAAWLRTELPTLEQRFAP